MCYGCCRCSPGRCAVLLVEPFMCHLLPLTHFVPQCTCSQPGPSMAIALPCQNCFPCSVASQFPSLLEFVPRINYNYGAMNNPGHLQATRDYVPNQYAEKYLHDQNTHITYPPYTLYSHLPKVFRVHNRKKKLQEINL